MAASMRRVPVDVPGFGAVDTAFVGPSLEELRSNYPRDSPAFVMLHGFDSSCMEFRRLHPLLAKQAPTYALDLVGALAKRGLGGHKGRGCEDAA